MRSLFVLFVFMGLVLTQNRVAAQNTPSAGFVFNDSSVARIDVLIAPDSLAALLNQANWYSDHEYPVDVIFTRGNRSDTISNVGFRLRGNTSRNAQKKSFRISINSFQSGRSYEGNKKLNLIASHNDPSMSRAKLYFDLTQRAGSVGSRAAHSALYINGQYRGLYTNVEHINDDYVQARFGNSNGNLYKCLFPADLVYISNNPNDYKLQSQGRRVYDLATNRDLDDYTDLALLIRTINQTPSANIYCALDTIFNIENFLLMMAIDVSTGHWDGYYNKNNFYLYHNTATGKFEFLPYDTDNTFGIDWLNVNWTTISPFSFKPNGQARPLYEKLMNNTETRAIYTYYIKKVSQLLQQPSWVQHIDSLKNRITPLALADNFRTLDYGYTNNDFLQSFTTTNSQGHVKSGIVPFVAGRATASLNTIPVNFNVAPIVHQLSVSGFNVGQRAQIRVKVEDEQPSSVAVVAQVLWQGVLLNIQLHDDGLHGDGAAGDGIFGASTPLLQAAGPLEIQIVATDAQANSRTRPCQPAVYSVRAGGPLFINEFLADNTNGIRDEANVASDWIELYNASTEPYALAGHMLSDNFNNPTKWTFPNDTIPAGGFYLVWASNEVTRGPRHAAFGLSKSGEEIGLYRLQAGQPVLLDSVSFGPQLEDVSMGRLSDGHPQWVSFNSPTPLQSNGWASSVPVFSSAIKVYPNPVRDEISVQLPQVEVVTYALLNALGQYVAQGVLPAQSEHRITLPPNVQGLFWLELRSMRGVEYFKLLRLP
jgi:spore coat protein CotH